MSNLIVIAALALLAACGPKKQADSKPGVYIDNQNLTPILLYKQYERCDGAAAESSSPYFYLTQFLRGMNLDRQVDMSPSVSGNQLKGYQIEQTFYDATMMLQEEYVGGSLVGLDFFVTNEPKAMSICPGVKSYERYSYENASMSATYAISKTASKLKEVGFSAPKGVRVFVSPYTIKRRIYETDDRVVREDLRLTDNAFYFAQMNAIVFMPQSEEARDSLAFGNIPLWEVPMVGSHEYGHHVFHNIMKNASGQMGLSQSSCFGMSLDATRENSFGPRSVGIGDVLGSLNEGVADLIAYYTLDNEERGLSGVRCMERNRDVGSASFGNRERKLFSRSMMDSFLSEEYEASNRCDEPNFQQIHIVGAVFANVSDRMMSALRLSKKQKLATTVNWLRDLNHNHPRLSREGAEAYLVGAYSLLAERAMRLGGTPPTQECDYVEFFMPESDFSRRELDRLGCR